VSWHLEQAELGAVERYSGPFFSDTTLPAGWYRVRHDDYTSSGYDRGHMTPSADRTTTTADNEATFLLTNVVPQAPASNQGPWAQLEENLRNRVRTGNEAYIVAGAQGSLGTIADDNVHRASSAVEGRAGATGRRGRPGTHRRRDDRTRGLDAQ
jgi:endonuclease G